MNYIPSPSDYPPPSPPGGNGPSFHLKVLVPAVAAGAIIGKGGETIAQLQKEAGARVKMSKANDYYPGTNERVCLISGNIDGVLKIHEFIMDKIKEKPDPNAKMAIDFDHKQPAERDKQVKVLVPNSTAGMIIGKGGSYIKQIKEESGAYVQISQKSRDHTLSERCITIIGEHESNRKACQMILQKVMEDPQSGTCLNVSYADVSGPVANFNPTGSPYAATGTSSGQSNVTHSNPSYSSNGSLNSLSPTLTNSFNSTQGTATPGGMMQFSGVGLNSSMPGNNSAQMIESIKTMLRVSGYSEDAVSEISSAMNTLANYGMLGLGLGLGSMINSVGGPMMTGPGGCPANLPLPPGGPNQHGTPASAGLHMAGDGSGGYPPIGAGMSLSSSGGPGFPRENRNTMADGEYPESPQRHNGRGTESPPFGFGNANSFGLEVGSPGGRKSPSPSDGEAQTKVEVEVGDNIVGAILGHGGKSLVEIQRISGASIQISKKGMFVPGTRNRMVSITGSASAVSTAQYLIEQQIGEEEQKRARQNAGLSSVIR